MQRGAGDRADADLDRLVRRLRGLSARAWPAAGRREAVVRLLVQLAALTAAGHAVPELPDYALADAVAVLGHDALTDPEHAEGAAQLLRDALDHTK